jgi:hypothetical protein
MQTPKPALTHNGSAGTDMQPKMLPSNHGPVVEEFVEVRTASRSLQHRPVSSTRVQKLNVSAAKRNDIL